MGHSVATRGYKVINGTWPLTLQFPTRVRTFTTLQVAVSSRVENAGCGTHLPLPKVLWCSPGLQCVSSENRNKQQSKDSVFNSRALFLAPGFVCN